MEPMIYKPSIYKGAGIYKAGAEGGGGGGDAIGGRQYATVEINGKTWLSENLDYKFVSISPGGVPTYPAAWYYNNDEATYNIDGPRKCGLLYNWYAAKLLNDNRADLCPGWHVPTKSEWDDLIHYLGDYNTATANKLKAINLDWAPNWGGNNDSGFSAVPAGYCEGNSFSSLTTIAGFWTCSQDVYNNGEQFSLGSSVTNIQDGKQYGYSIRLVKD